MPAQHYTHGSVIQPIFFAELLQGLAFEFQELSQFHSYIISNFQEMSRKKRQGLNWGNILKQFRKDAHLTGAEFADALGYKAQGKGEPKGMISEIEQGKLPINEDKIRVWVKHCGKNMFDFYKAVGEHEVDIFLPKSKQPPKKP